MAQEVGKLARSLDGTKSQVGGLSRSMAYALENEAYRKLPAYLKIHCELDIRDRFIRTEVGGEEINIFAKATRNGEEVLIIGETVLKLDDRSKMGQLERKVQAVRNTSPLSIIPLVITHYARPRLLEKVQQEGVLVVQSFEWD